MAITRWDPFRDVLALQNRMNSLFQDFNRGQGETDALTTAAFVPPVDVYEDEHKVTLKLEIPGVNQDELDIRVENNTLTIKGSRKFEKDENVKGWHRIERSYGDFVRSFSLPNTLDTEKVAADYKNGVLTITLPRKESAKPKSVKVAVQN